MPKEVFKEKLLSLIHKFEKDKYHYLSKGYLEAEVRQDFLDPLFEALGWDIGNKKKLSPFDREVVVEKGETTGRPDYNFRIDGATKFFVEAKSPSVALDNVNHILQAKYYAWSTKEVFFVILTDFEEFKLFDASLKPDPKRPNEGLILDFKYTDYRENIDKLWLLSKEEVEKGSLEGLLPRDVKSKRLRIPVDRAFLEDMTEWRTELAKDIHKRNPEIDVRLLNEVVQKLLDRIVFIRIAEDRKIRDANELKEIIDVWKLEGKRKPLLTHLKDLFSEVNADLNGDIFKPHACESVDVDSNLLADIIENLYFPKCRYRFDVIGVELLGSIYERYLGSTIRVTPQRVKVEEKPEVRKAGGVYYTPRYIVDYIVKNTVGKLIEGKTPKQIEKIRILDPACGSGSFLLGAYQYLLNYHLEYFRKHPKEAQVERFDFYQKFDAEDFALLLRTKARILKNNIYGVDIDPQAVEITMMSLYLKLLEGERSLPSKQALLPTLTYNIRCGNSLIGYDIFDQGSLFDDETKTRINPFDWKSKNAGFGDIIESGGFDAVIGNPPYFNIDKVWGKKSPIANLIKQSYPDIWADKTDILFYFLAKAIILSRQHVGFIVSRAFLEAYKAKKLREFILSKTKILSVTDFNGFHVFEAGVSTAIPILEIETNPTTKSKNKIAIARLKTSGVSADQVRKALFEDIETNQLFETFHYGQKELTNDSWNFVSTLTKDINHKIDGNYPTLGKICDVGQGMQTGRNDVFGNLFPEDIERFGLEKSYLKKRAANSDVQRHFIIDRSESLIYIEDISSFKEVPDNIAAYLKSHESELKKRAAFKRNNCDWWKFTWPLHKEWYCKPKILCPYLAGENRFALDTTNEFIGLTDTTVIFTKDSLREDLRYLLALLNSNLLTYRFKSIGKLKSKGIYEYFWNSITKLPIRTIDFKNPSEKAVHDKLVSLVDRMLELHKKKNSMPPSAERERVEREITVTDEKIDEIVYGLYGVTEEERKIIEGKG